MNKPNIKSSFCAAGFTLAELMVAVAITALLILAINQVFSSVSKGVRAGIGASEVLQNARIISQQLEKDFTYMLGPGGEGVLVIVNRSFGDPSVSTDGVHVLRIDDLDENGAVNGSENRSDVRDDQIMFIYDPTAAGSIQPLCPGSTSSYSNTSNAPAVKIWYGHGLRSKPDGTDPANELGDAYTPGSSNDVAANHFASEWVLARQALFLENGSTKSLYANSAVYNSPLTGTLGYSSTPLTLATGITDIAKFGFKVEDASAGCMVGGDANSGSPINGSVRLWKTSSDASAGAAEYATRAYKYLYLPASSSQHRLLVNPTPDTSSASFAPWQIAQMTPYLCGHVSDFVVEFAGDYASNSPSNSDTSTSGAPDGEIDRYSDGSIVWYGLKIVPPTTGSATGHFVSQSSTTVAQNPIYHNVSATEHRFVFRHDTVSPASADTNWPYLIRIRYRLVDSKGQIIGADGEPGRWFEQIMTVNRN